jgi:outer membrane protein TolC
MRKSKLTLLVCLSTGLSPIGRGFADETESAAAVHPTAAWVQVKEAAPHPLCVRGRTRSTKPAATLLAPQSNAQASAGQSLSVQHPLWEQDNGSILWNLESEAAPRTASLSPLIISEGHRDLQIQAEGSSAEADYPIQTANSPAQTNSPAMLLWNLDNSDLDRVPMLSANVPSADGQQLEIVTDGPLRETSEVPLALQEKPEPVESAQVQQPQPPLLALNSNTAEPSQPAEPEGIELNESGIAIPLVEPLHLEAIRVAALHHNNNVRVVRYQQEEVATEIDIAESVFDPTFGANLYGGESYRQNRNLIQSLGTASPIQNSFYLRPYEENQIYLRKRNYLGGEASVGITSDYLYLDPADMGVFVNPGWDSRLRFRYQQSLLRGFGREVNTAPIYIAARRADQSAFLFQAAVQVLLRDVELAYWDWELAWNLQQLLEQDEQYSQQLADQESERLQIGTGTVATDAEARERHLRSKIRLVQGMNLSVLGELKVRQVAGLPVEDGVRFLPADSAETEREYDDLYLALSRSMHRPEVLAQRAAIAAATKATVIARNGLRPDLSRIMEYSALGLGERLDESLSTVGDARFYEWIAGVRYTQPLYWRAERAIVRRADWAVAREQAILDQIHLTIAHQIAAAHENVHALAAQLEILEERMQVSEIEREARRELYENRRGQIEDLFDSQDRLLQARTDFRLTLAQYQKAITELRYASGMIFDQQVIVEDEIPVQPPAPPAQEPQENDVEASAGSIRTAHSTSGF